MKIVIDISEARYKDIKRIAGVQLKSNYFQTAEQIIARGTPLPKGHGRLKDVDKIEWYGCTTAFDCPYKERECKDCDRSECSKTQVDDIPTIIEADTESEEV